MSKKQEEIPVYIFLGFLESGKTTFINETLVRNDFNEGEPTLLLVFEDGTTDFDEEYLKNNNIFVEYLDEIDIDYEKLIEFQEKYKPTRVYIEYNGMWSLDKMFKVRVPIGWVVVQVITFVNAITYDNYIKNMKSIIMEQITTADMVVFNRCNSDTRINDYIRSIKVVNRRAQLIFENENGVIDITKQEIILPFDTSKDFIEIKEEDFGVWYIDATDNPNKYKGKTIKIKAMVHKVNNYASDEFVIGRFAMTCCADDIAFIGLKCRNSIAKELSDRDWVIVTGMIAVENYPEFQNDGPVIIVENIEMTTKAKEELIYFN